MLQNLRPTEHQDLSWSIVFLTGPGCEQGIPFNLSNLLAQQLWIHVSNALSPPKGGQSIFYMYAYLLDAICAHNAFCGMNWTWTPCEPNAYVYCKLISKWNQKGVMEKLTDHFLIPLCKLIFEEELSWMSHGEMEAVLEIVDWFALLDGTFLKVFGEQKIYASFTKVCHR